MHELSIAESVVTIAERHAAGRPVAKVELRVGHLRQVVPSALSFAFELLSEGTVLEGAELEIEDVPAAGRCRSCGSHTTLPGFPIACAHCGGFDVEVTEGEELLVDSLELHEDSQELQRASLRSGPSPLLAQGKASLRSGPSPLLAHNTTSGG